MKQQLERDLKKHFQKLLLIYSSALVLGAVAVHWVRSDEKSRLAQALAASVTKDLLVRDYRQAILGLNVAVPAEFSSIHFYNEQGESVFSIPEVQEEGNLKARGFFESSLKQKVGLSGSRQEFFSHLEFRYSIFQNLVMALVLWIFLVLLSVPLARKTREQIVRSYDVDMQAQLAALRLDMARQVSHDLRAPLAALNVVVRNAEGLNPDQKELVSQVATRMGAIANQLLEKSQSTELVLEALDLRDSLKQIVQEKNIALKAGVVISLRLPDFEIKSKINESEWMRVLSNVLNNSIEAIEGDGRVEVALERNEEFARISIRDTGKGIPQDVLPRIFDKNSSYGKSSSVQGEAISKSGSGLGLHHCKTVITAWGGEVTVQSSESKGTTVVICLPLV